MRKSMSLAEEGPVAIDTRVGALGQKNHSLDTRKDLAPTSLRMRQKKSSVSSFGSNVSKVAPESGSAERRKKFSLCTGFSYDSQLSLGVEQLQLQGGANITHICPKKKK